MRKLTIKQKRYQRMRARYEARRRSPIWKKRRKQHKWNANLKRIKRRKQAISPVIQLEAPKDFSLVQNTNAVLEYLVDARKRLRQDEKVMLDVSKVEALTPESIALLVACVNDPWFIGDGIVYGNAPNREDLKKMMTESGFYEYVRTKNKFKQSGASLLHKEKHTKVEPEVAKLVIEHGRDHVFGAGTTKDLGAMYEILIECMSNTNSHADLTKEGSCYWWLFVHNDPTAKISTYAFLDLGVGIFKSATVQGFLKTLGKAAGLYPNINIVDDLIKGKIKSRAKIDTDIRGKGIPQIVDNSKTDYFRSFYIIANDVKLDLKTGQKEQLQYALNGTLLYWELQAV
jgi:hypothetical protein